MKVRLDRSQRKTLRRISPGFRAASLRLLALCLPCGSLACPGTGTLLLFQLGYDLTRVRSDLSLQVFSFKPLLVGLHPPGNQAVDEDDDTKGHDLVERCSQLRPARFRSSATRPAA